METSTVGLSRDTDVHPNSQVCGSLRVYMSNCVLSWQLLTNQESYIPQPKKQ